MRTFIAVELPGEVQEKVGEYINSINDMFRYIKWVLPHNLHFTLKFLGEVGDSQLSHLGNCISATASEINSFSIDLNGVGYFPSSKRPRVIWIGADGGADHMLEMFQLLENHLEKVGFDRETRAFSTHLTIGRARKDRKIRVPVGLPEFEPVSFRVNSLALIKSTLTLQGPIYEKTFESELLQDN